MKIALVTSRFPYGKGEGFLIAEIEALAERVELFVVPMAVDSRQPVHPNGAQHVIRAPLLSLGIALGAFAELIAHPRRVAQIAATILKADNRRQIIVKNLAVLPKGLWLARKLRSWNIAHVHAHWASASATLAWIAALEAGIPWSFTGHRWDITEANALKGKLQSCAFARAISTRGARAMRSFAPEAAVRVIHMGVAVPTRAPSSASSGALRLLVPANLLPVKGHAYLIEALALLEGHGCVQSCEFAGDGPEYKRLCRLVEDLRLGHRIRFCGALPHAEILNRYQSNLTDVVVLPSIRLDDGTHEGIPVALMEAMSYSIPVISTRTGAIGELVEGAGILVEPADARALAEAIRSLYDPKRRLELGALGHERVHQQFNADCIAAQIADLIREVQLRPAS